MNVLPRLLVETLFVVAALTPMSWAAAEATKSADVASPPSETAAIPAPSVENGYLKLGFEHLASYPFTPPPFDPAAAPSAKPATGEEQIPATVKAWNGKKAMITGYMMPVKMDKGLATEFLLMRNTMSCCYGAVPSMTEWVIVKMKKGVEPLMDVPIAVYGELKVGAMFDNGYMTGLYELQGERMEEVGG